MKITRVYWGNMIDHSLPLILLVLDFILNAVPVVQRHLAVILAVASLFVIDNFIATKIRGKPVYDILKWNDLASVILTIAIFILLMVLFLILNCINTGKLRSFASRRQQER